MDKMKENENDLSFNFAKEFQINNKNKFDFVDQGKSFLGSSRNYRLTFKINDKEVSLNKTYSDIRRFYKKVVTEFPFLIFPHLYGKKENVSLEERNDNIRYIFSQLVRFNDIVNSDFLLSYIEENKVLLYSIFRKIIVGKHFQLNIFAMKITTNLKKH
jgi:hypothetical protein